MRKRIRLTGRRQIARSSVKTNVAEVGSNRLVSLSIVHPEHFRHFPSSARVKLRLYENKVSETLEFGPLDSLKTTAELKNPCFSAPSCQLRIVATDVENKGLLLGSTNTWTMRADINDQGSAGSEGILMFQPFNIRPRTWKLSIRDNDYPVVYIDQGIPNSRTWVRNDPVFISCVLPAIIREVFEEILIANGPPEQDWMRDWLSWADTLMPGKYPPYFDGRSQQQLWIDDLLDTFCQKHGALDLLIGRLQKGQMHGEL